MFLEGILSFSSYIIFICFLYSLKLGFLISYFRNSSDSYFFQKINLFSIHGKLQGHCVSSITFILSFLRLLTLLHWLFLSSVLLPFFQTRRLTSAATHQPMSWLQSYAEWEELATPQAVFVGLMLKTMIPTPTVTQSSKPGEVENLMQRYVFH